MATKKQTAASKASANKRSKPTDKGKTRTLSTVSWKQPTPVNAGKHASNNWKW